MVTVLVVVVGVVEGFREVGGEIFLRVAIAPEEVDLICVVAVDLEAFLVVGGLAVFCFFSSTVAELEGLPEVLIAALADDDLVAVALSVRFLNESLELEGPYYIY